MSEKALPDHNAVEKLYKQQASSLFMLYFIHTSQSGETRALIKEQVGDWLTDARSYAAAKTGIPAALRQAHRLCMQYYRRKPRKKIKAERLKKIQQSFPITDDLISVLHLPLDVKSPVVLCFGLGFSSQEAAIILKCSEAWVTKRLNQAKARLNKSPEEIKAVLNNVRLPESKLDDIFDRIIVDASEKGYSGKRRLNRWKRNLDRIITYIAAVFLILLLFAFLAVHFGWFGTAYNTYEYDYDSTPLISEIEDRELPT